MPVFISYSHKNKDFVDNLAGNLIKAKTHIWVDRWEISVGESVIEKLQSAIKKANALIIVLSKEYVESEWCKRELNAGIVRELEEKKVLILPILVEDCEIPIFLREKKYADFRTEFDEAFQDILSALDKITSLDRGRIDEPDWTFDWSMDWGFPENMYFRYTILQFAKDQPYSLLTQIMLIPNQIEIDRYVQFEREDLGWVKRHAITLALMEATNLSDNNIVIENQLAVTRNFVLSDPKNGSRFDVTFEFRWLGTSTGNNLLVDIGHTTKLLFEAMNDNIRPLTEEEAIKALNIIRG